MSKYHIALEPGKFYHIYNHAVGDEKLFRSDNNFQFFLRKYLLHTELYCDTYAYALMPNHFHFVIKTKPLENIIANYELVKQKKPDGDLAVISDFLMERFSNWLNSYTKAYNKVLGRKGSLFIDYMKRIEITSNQYLLNVINYIHFNAVHHGFCKNPSDWNWVSLHAYLLNKNTKVKKQEGLILFDGIENFKLQHVKMCMPLSEYEFL
jgi:putative transposase